MSTVVDWKLAAAFPQGFDHAIGWHVSDSGELEEALGELRTRLAGRMVQVHAGEHAFTGLPGLLQGAIQEGALCYLSGVQFWNRWEVLAAVPSIVLELFPPNEDSIGQIAKGPWPDNIKRAAKHILNRPSGKPIEVAEFGGLVTSLVEQIGPERVVFGSAGLDSHTQLLTLQTLRSHVPQHFRKLLLARNSERIYASLVRTQTTEVPVHIRFVPPYARTRADICTGSLMIDEGMAEEWDRLQAGSVLLSPYSEVALSRADVAFAQRQGLCLLDSPWDKLEAETQAERGRGLHVRRIPDQITACNPFYRSDNPTYFASPHRLATAEAAAIALLLLGACEQAADILARLSYGCKHMDLLVC